eukprot:445504-Pelagomonas_calceolata.AAC.3
MQAVQHNGTLYMHVVFAKTGRTINPDDPEYDEDLVFGRTERKYLEPGHPYSSSADRPAHECRCSYPEPPLQHTPAGLTLHLPRPKNTTGVNLLTSDVQPVVPVSQAMCTNEELVPQRNLSKSSKQSS